MLEPTITQLDGSNVRMAEAKVDTLRRVICGRGIEVEYAAEGDPALPLYICQRYAALLLLERGQ